MQYIVLIRTNIVLKDTFIYLYCVTIFMEVGSDKLNEIILEFDKHLTREITIVAIGGTALTLLGKKESTKDIDICFLTDEDKERFIELAKMLGYSIESGRIVGHGLIIDAYSGGYIFCVQLPDDYKDNASLIGSLKRINLFSLSPEDLIITKTARLNQRDFLDIKKIFESFDIDKENLVSRYMQIMENSVVRDAKLNMIWIADEFQFPKKLKEKIERWEYA